MIRLNKFIASCGLCSRRQADSMISQGKVKINGKIVYNLGTSVDDKNDKVEVYGNILKLEKSKLYIMLNKPAGYITTSKEQFGRPCILDLINEKERLFPVGRLDMDTEGLILMTNDGEFANKLMHPSKKVEKTYIAKVSGNITEDKIAKLKSGVNIDGYVTKDAKVRQFSKNSLEIIIHEGKNRQIKKMCMAVGLKVEKLRRIKIGNLELGDLDVGQYRVISKKQINSMFDNK